jgi:hypothetical protein
MLHACAAKGTIFFGQINQALMWVFSFPILEGMIRQCIWIVDRLDVIAVIQSMNAHGHQIRTMVKVLVSIF